MKPFENYFERHRIIFATLILLVIAFVLYLFRNTGIICDEKDNYPQILNFIKGDYRLLEISAVPGYHACMAIALKITGHTSLFAARCTTIIFGILSVLVFYLIIIKINREVSILRTFQYLLFPSIFIYYFTLYTDILSLLFVMTMLLFALDRRYILAGIFSILSMLIRQNNVIWVAFIPMLAYYESFQLQFSIKNSMEIFRKTWVFFLGMALFVVFVILNKGVAVGDAASHPAFKFSTGNIFFLLFCTFVFFLPMHIANIPKVFNYLMSGMRPTLLSITLFIIYWFTFKNDHPYNQIATYYFIRNFILVAFTKSSLLKAVFFIPIVYTFLSLIVTPLGKKSWYLFYVFTILFLLPSWLIEQRYYMIPFVLFMLFRKDQSLFFERITVLYYIGILMFLLPYVVSLKLFL